MYLQNNTLLQGGKYKIINHISSGGFGNTYEGVHAMMDTRVAIKEFFPKMFCNRDEITSHVTVATQGNRELVEKLRKKFIKEARSIFKMNHPNIVKVHDIFEENGTAYYVMDFIEGESLGDIVKQRGALPESEAVGYSRQVADALKYVHSLNRLHLDIKPGNIMVDKNGKAILIDFGASKHYDDDSGENTSTLMGVNTKGYAPIEQSTQSFTSFSPATDIYALGATLYKLLTGITPVDANLVMAREDVLAPLPANISSTTRNAVLKAMTLIRAERLQSIESFLSLLNGRIDSSTYNEATVLENGGAESTTKSLKHNKFIMSGWCTFFLFTLLAFICIAQPVLFNMSEWAWNDFSERNSSIILGKSMFEVSSSETTYWDDMNYLRNVIVYLIMLSLPVCYVMFYRGKKYGISFYSKFGYVFSALTFLLIIIFSQYVIGYFSPDINYYLALLVNAICYSAVLIFTIVLTILKIKGNK